MPAELSIGFTHLEKEAVSLIGSGRTYAQQVADELDLIVATPDGQPKPDFLAVQLGLVQTVEDGLHQIDTYDESLVEELDGDRGQLAERNAATVELDDQLSRIQNAYEGVYGKAELLELFGHVETLPRDPRRLAKLGRRVHRRLGAEDFTPPEPKLKGWVLSEREELVTDLGKAVTRLAAALETLNDERKASIGTRSVKTGAVDGFRRTLRHAGDCLASLYSLAGFDELAARIRPKRRRRRRAAGDDGGAPTEAAPESPSQDSGGDAAPEPPAGPRLVVS